MTDETRTGFDTGPPPAYDAADFSAENRRLRSGLEQMRDEVLRLGRALEPMHRLHEDIIQLRAELDHYKSESNSCHECAERLEEELRAATKREQTTSEQLAAVYASSSWQLTRPLRWLMRRLRP